MSVRSYSPTDVDILLGGFYKLNGFTEGSFVSISKDVQPYSTTRTADGKIGRTYINDQTYTITISLASTSPGNDILTRVHQADQLTQYAKFPMFIKDRLGTSLFLAPTCWVREVPDLEFSTNVTTRTWVIQATEAIPNFGGNGDASDALDDLAAVTLGKLATSF